MFEGRSPGMSGRTMLYGGIVILTPLYGAETGSVGAPETTRLDVGELRCLRSMCGVTGVRNEV